MTSPVGDVSLEDVLLSAPPPERTVQRTSSVRLVSSPTAEGGVSESRDRDSLHDTREHYGLSPLSGPSNPLHRSTSTRQTHHRRTLSNATSRHSSSSRPTSPDPRRLTSNSAGSGRSSAVPLPLYRGFLSPKKPKSAIKLEEQERRASLSSRDGQRTGRPVGSGSGSGWDVGEDGSMRTRTGRISEENNGGPSSTSRDMGDMPNGLPSGGSRPTASKAERFSDELYSGPANIRHSLAEASSQPGTVQAEYSSDDLVPANHRTNGSQPDPEKGNNQRPSPLHRPSIHHRGTSSRRSPTRPRPEAQQRRYQLSDNPLSTFFLRGHLMTGGDNRFSVTLVLVFLFGITGVWFGTTGVWYWRYASDYGLARGSGVAIDIIFVYLFGLTFSSFLAASLREPGVIPRDLDPDPPMSQGSTDSWYQPLDRGFAVKKGRVVVRYCETCRSYRPPRSSHCRMCGNCVDGIDHHCSYLHTCVGKRTYLAFLTLLISAGISCIYAVVFSALHFSLLCHVDSIGFGTAIQRSPGAAVSFLLAIAVLPGVIFLLSYHVRLLIYNLTTVEQIRASASRNLLRATKRPDNPFAADSILGNILLSTLARPQFPSWIQAWKVVELDRRAVNPALTEERWVKMGYNKGMR